MSPWFHRSCPRCPPSSWSPSCRPPSSWTSWRGNIGYLRIDSIIGEDVAEKVGPLLLELVWNKILPTSGLIFDLRYTSSGDLSGIPYIISYLTDTKSVVHIDTIYDRPLNTTTKLLSMESTLGQTYGGVKPLISPHQQEHQGHRGGCRLLPAEPEESHRRGREDRLAGQPRSRPSKWEKPTST
ncbi:Retinol-binding protein 3 [Oryzias melastigma]|uniref:Retinol-binding protein 3 n=1 Tax=Oryzias melastigma TaxID=30732 RepID=A0A834F331_ORYME|nr:Retinol-binding protein 3 [Oryzias melastigma]